MRDIIPQKKFDELMSKSGIGNDTTVILYGDNNNWFAAWAFWQMKVYGHRDVRIMNGGRKKWVAEGRELETAVPSIAPASYKASAPDLSIRAFLPEVQEAVKQKSAVLIDVRGPQEFTGEILSPPGLAGDLPARRPHPRREEHPMGEGVQRRRHVQDGRRAEAAVRRRRRDRRQARHRLLPHRRAVEPHVVRPQAPAGLPRTSRTTTARGPNGETSSERRSKSRSATSMNAEGYTRREQELSGWSIVLETYRLGDNILLHPLQA